MANCTRKIIARRRAFSLLEVVVAIAIFAIGMMAVVGLFTPVARSVGTSADLEAAARVADALRAKLQSMPANDVVALLKQSTGAGHALTEADARPDYNPTADAQILFASRDGSKIGGYNDTALWGPRTAALNPDREKYFEIALIRNEALTPLPVPAAEGEATPPDPAATAYLIAYTARLRWPAFVRDGATNAIQVGNNPAATVRFDHSMKQVMFVTGSVTR